MRLYKPSQRRWPHSMLAASIFGFSLTTTHLWASNPIAEAQKIAERSQAASRTSQVRIEKMHDIAQERLDEILEHEREWQLTSAYNRQLQVLLDSQQKELARLEEAIGLVDEMERGMLPLLSEMNANFRSFVEQDMLFLKDERIKRLQKLEALLKQADQTVAEKYRQLLQAHQVELEYGRQLESYSGILEEAGAPHEGLQVNFVRLGRLAFYYQTLDGRESALWQPDQQQWEQLAAIYNPELSQAIRIARSQALPTLLNLPLPRVAEGGAQ